MSELGQWLREARQAQDLSLEQIEADTRIRVKFLAALEEEDFDKLPDKVAAKGLLRNYALFLGLDPAEALEKYEEGEARRQSSEPSLFRPLEVALFRTPAGKARRRLLVLGLFAGLITVGLWGWKTGRLTVPPLLAMLRPTETPTVTSWPTRTATGTAQATATRRPSPTLRPTRTATSTSVLIEPTSTSSPTPLASPSETPTATMVTPEPTREDTLTPSLTPLAGAAVTLTITITETSWVEVTVDSRSVLRRLMEPGEQGSWKADREIILRLGNAGGVEVTVNDEFLGALGERQQVVEFAWGPEGEVTPAPTATYTPTPEATTEIQETPTR